MWPIPVASSVTPAGNAVIVHGTNDRVPGSDYPAWQCLVDDVVIRANGPVPFFENGFTLCQDLDLDDGPHQLVVNVITGTAGETFWFDDIQYSPSPSSSESGGIPFVKVRSLDPAIVYSAGWGPFADVANMTSKTGAEVKFTFTGMYHAC